MSATRQPEWEYVANLGDASPIDHGGFFIFEDRTGVYPPEVEVLIPPEEDDSDEDFEDEDSDEDPVNALLEAGAHDEDEEGKYLIFRFVVEPCTYINGILSDNKFHPDHPAWFATPEERKKDRPQDSTYLSCIASAVGRTTEDLIKDFLSEDVKVRAAAWREVGEVHGWENLDSYPQKVTRKEAKERYAGMK